QLVGGDHAELRIAIFPPELMSDDVHLEVPVLGPRVFGCIDDAGRAKKQHEHDEDGDDRPGQLDVLATVDLRRLAAVVVFRLPEFDQRVGDETEYDHEDRRGDGIDHQRKVEYRTRRGGSGREDVRRAHGYDHGYFAEALASERPGGK